MFKTLINTESLHIWPLSSLIIFFTIMLTACFWVYRPGSKDLYKKIANLALSNEKQTRSFKNER